MSGGSPSEIDDSCDAGMSQTASNEMQSKKSDGRQEAGEPGHQNNLAGVMMSGGSIGSVTISSCQFSMNTGTARTVQDESEMERQFIALFNEETKKNTQDNIRGVYEDLDEPSQQVNPEFLENEFFKGDTASVIHTYKPDLYYKQQIAEQMSKTKKVTIKQLLDGARCTALIGSMGSGKTTTAKRFANLVLNEEIPSLEDIKLVHFVNIAELNWESKFKPYRLIFHEPIGDAANDFVDFGPKWILKNDKKVLLILDGLDQSKQSLWDEKTKVTSETKASAHLILYNLLSGKLFPKCKILTTSRAVGIYSCPQDCRPNKTISILQLQPKDCEFLIKEYFGEKGDKIWEHLMQKVPGSLSLFQTPVYLLFTAAVIKEDPKFAPDTTTEILIRVVSCFMQSDSRNNIEKFFTNLCKLAYQGTHDQTIIFRNMDISSDLEGDVSGFLKTTPRKSTLNTSKLMKGSKRMSFIHQSLQEALAALWIVKMDLREFQSCIQDLFSLTQFQIVRNIAAGILLNVRVNDDSNLDVIGNINEKEAKIDFLIKWIEEQIRQKRKVDDVGLCLLLQECGDGFEKKIDLRNYEKFASKRNLNGVELLAIIKIMARCQNIKSAQFNSFRLDKNLLDMLYSTLQRISFLKLRSLYVTLDQTIDRESYTQFAEVIRFSNTDSLILYDSELSQENMEMLSVAMKSVSVKLRELHLIKNSLMETASFPFVAEILETSEAKALSLLHCQLSQDKLNGFSQSFSGRNIKLQELSVTLDETMDSESYTDLAEVIRISKIDSLILCNSELSQENMKMLSHAIKEASVKLQELRVSLDQSMDNESYTHLAKVVSFSKSDSLMICDSELSQENMKMLSHGMKKASVKLHTLGLVRTTVKKAEAFRYVVQVLKFSNAVKLGMQDCELSVDKLQHISQGLKSRSVKLQLLFVTLDQSMDNESYNHLAKVVSLSKTDSLLLCNSELSQENMKMLSHGMKKASVKVIHQQYIEEYNFTKLLLAHDQSEEASPAPSSFSSLD